MENEVPFPSTDHVIKYPDMWTDIAVNEIPKYLRELANKYNMHFKLVSDIEMAMFNEKCCLLFGVDRDIIMITITFLERGKRVEYGVDNYLTKYLSQKVRNRLTVIARGLDSKWSSLLQGDMSWFEGYKRSRWFSERHNYVEERNKILDEIVAWQVALR